jgi:uncharacterized protein with gpF-like domain
MIAFDERQAETQEALAFVADGSLLEENSDLRAYGSNAEQAQSTEILAQDASPAIDLKHVIGLLRRRWLRRFDRASQDLAKYFAVSVKERSDADLKRILKKAGMTVEFKLTQDVRDALNAIVAENVSLIKSIPEQYLTQVEGLVMRSVVAGRDLKTLTDELQQRYQITRRRAAFIAIDQGNKSTSAIQKIRYLDAGIERAVWHHSHAGREPRPTHVANDGKEYDVKTGWWDPAVKQHIIPGFLPRCRCFSSPILPE